MGDNISIVTSGRYFALGVGVCVAISKSQGREISRSCEHPGFARVHDDSGRFRVKRRERRKRRRNSRARKSAHKIGGFPFSPPVCFLPFARARARARITQPQSLQSSDFRLRCFSFRFFSVSLSLSFSRIFIRPSASLFSSRARVPGAFNRLKSRNARDFVEHRPFCRPRFFFRDMDLGRVHAPSRVRARIIRWMMMRIADPNEDTPDGEYSNKTRRDPVAAYSITRASSSSVFFVLSSRIRGIWQTAQRGRPDVYLYRVSLAKRVPRNDDDAK